jgi:predicted DsbA family dithiol-disulfide isomerase
VQELQIDVWSDIACPWCYIGKRRLEGALARFEHRDQVRVRWHAFELDRSAPRERDGDYAAHLAKKYGASKAQAEQMIARVVSTAAAEGLAYDYDRIRPGNTFDAHRLVHLGLERGVQDAVEERFMRGYLCEGVPIGNGDALAPLAVEAGLDPAEVKDVLATDRYADAVRADEQQAAALGISGVPFFVIAGRLGVSGAQPADVMVGALTRGWELGALEVVADGEACGPDGCD